MAASGAELQLSGISKSYDGTRTVLDHIDLVAGPGELVSLLGPSGCGKSTALRIVSGLIEPTSGRILVAGRDVTALPPYARNMGVVFQSYALFPHLSVAENVAFGLEMRGIARREVGTRVSEALALVRLEGLQDRKPRQLSGGQQQRVALARALVVRPDVLLLDEPLSNLDAKLREDMRNEIRELQLRAGITTIFVTHDQAEALAMSDRVAMMHAGRIIQCGTPVEIYEHPATEAVAEFIGRVNRMRGRVEQTNDSHSLIALEGAEPVWVPGIMQPGGTATVMVRPHRTRLVLPDAAPDDTCNRVAATLTKMVYTGDQVQVIASAGPLTFLSEGPSHLPAWQVLQPGQPVMVEWSIGDGLGFPATA